MGVIFGIFSVIASIISGLVVFRKKLPIKVLALLGLSNFFTIAGFFITSLIVIRKRQKEKVGKFLIMLGALCVVVILYFVGPIMFGTLFNLLPIFLLLVLVLGVIYWIITAPEFFGYVILFSICFLLLFCLTYLFLISSYPYKVGQPPYFCRQRAIEYCLTQSAQQIYWEDFAPGCMYIFPDINKTVCEELGVY